MSKRNIFGLTGIAISILFLLSFFAPWGQSFWSSANHMVTSGLQPETLKDFPLIALAILNTLSYYGFAVVFCGIILWLEFSSPKDLKPLLGRLCFAIIFVSLCAMGLCLLAQWLHISNPLVSFVIDPSRFALWAHPLPFSSSHYPALIPCYLFIFFLESLRKSGAFKSLVIGGFTVLTCVAGIAFGRWTVGDIIAGSFPLGYVGWWLSSIILQRISKYRINESPRSNNLGDKHYPHTILKGMFIGSADIIPGVSGATVAYLIGFYPRLIAMIKSFDIQILKDLKNKEYRQALRRPHWSVLIPLFIGLLMGIVFFTKIVSMPLLLKTWPQPVYGLFFGLILGSIPFLLRNVPFKVQTIIWGGLGILAGWGLASFVPGQLETTPLILFLAGFLAFGAMLMPGVSGSYVLLILGQYSVVMMAVSTLKFSILLPLALGAGIAAVTLSRVLSALLHRYPQAMACVITGMLFGSLWRIWPFQKEHKEVINGVNVTVSNTPTLPLHYTTITWLSLLLIFIGVISIFMIDYKKSKFSKSKSE